MTTHSGGCHCGAVRFEVDAPAYIAATQCNCSICSMTGFLHLLVAKRDFRLLQGEDALTTYTFNTGVAQHHFCRHCGVKSFYVPRSHPDGYSININCLDPGTISGMTTQPFDGRNWEENISKLSSVSE
ncbi:MAG: GFA family protein [Woeseiaceae bacterium]